MRLRAASGEDGTRGLGFRAKTCYTAFQIFPELEQNDGATDDERRRPPLLFGAAAPGAPKLYPEEIARAEELERKLGRPLRLEIDGPLTDEESEDGHPRPCDRR